MVSCPLLYLTCVCCIVFHLDSAIDLRITNGGFLSPSLLTHRTTVTLSFSCLVVAISTVDAPIRSMVLFPGASKYTAVSSMFHILISLYLLHMCLLLTRKSSAADRSASVFTSLFVVLSLIDNPCLFIHSRAQ